MFFAFDFSRPITSEWINIFHWLLILRRAYLAIKNLPPPLSYGCEAKYVYAPIMTDVLSVPLELMKLSVYGCKTNCKI